MIASVKNFDWKKRVFGPAFFALAFLAAASLAGCDRLHTERLRKLQLKVGGNPVLAEIAATPDDRQRGLMYRSSLGAEEGMLFAFAAPEVQVFWMKNTLIPLDVGFFDADLFLITVRTMEPDDGASTHSSNEPALYALEMNKGWFAKKGLRKYAKLELPETILGL